MSELQKLRVNQLRNLSSVSLELSPRINWIYGANGSGKTSLLEAIYLLGLGRSFRSRLAAPLISSGQSELVVYGQIRRGSLSHGIGISKSKSGETRLRLDGANVNSMAEVAKLLPVVLVVPETFELLTGGPRERRQFLDWGVFHVKHSYMGIWRNFQRSLKQRNSLLRRGRIDAAELAVWNDHLVESAELIDRYRTNYLDQLRDTIKAMLTEFNSQMADVRLDYVRGWPKDRSYRDALEDSLERDRTFGKTSYGPHKADLRISVLGLDARDHLSRGQQKVVICALKLAQGVFLSQVTNVSSVYLVDDLHAELDEANALTFCRILEESGAQVFITSLDNTLIEKYWSRSTPLKMFHVEHGSISEAPTL